MAKILGFLLGFLAEIFWDFCWGFLADLGIFGGFGDFWQIWGFLAEKGKIDQSCNIDVVTLNIEV